MTNNVRCNIKEIGELPKFFRKEDVKTKKITNVILAVVLIVTVASAPVSAKTIVSTPIEPEPIGADTTGFVCETSNPYSKNFTVHYTFVTPEVYQQNEQLIFHLQADSQGNVYIKDFAAHHYGEISQEG